MTQRSEQISLHLNAYLTAHSSPPDAVLRELANETADLFPNETGLQIAPEQGTLMTLLTQLAGAASAIEIGTFTGYSSICIARGLEPGGTLLCCDISEEWTSVARKYWEKAGLADRIELRLGPAMDTLASLPDRELFDLAFIDADKTGYLGYWRHVVPRIRPGGLIMVDNTFSHGRVIDAGNDNPAVFAIRDFNDHAAADDRVDLVMVPIGDGLTLARKKLSFRRDRAAEVERADLGVLQDLAPGPGQPYPAVFHHHAVSGEPQPGPRVLLHQQDRGARRVHLPDRVEHGPQDLRRQAHRRLVEQQQPRLEHQRAGELDQPLLPARQAAGLLPGPLCDLREHLADGREPACGQRPVGQDVAAQLDVLADGHVAEQAVVLRHLDHAEPQDLARRPAGEILAVQQHRPQPRPQQPADRRHQRGFARAVRAYDAGDAALGHLQGYSP
jgi:caffeoyl-CoA O-methyltransferase